ncbi:MAG: hypothetical protein PF436_08785 [Prolixibacteraceae bacterium]|jgi:hypothetical protein|nr:hypothetical protein [Prolixibacteraceae bacterium]
MKNRTSLIIILIFTFLSVSTKASERFHASMSFGAGFSSGIFKQISPLADDAGYAKSGFTMNVDGDYYLHNRIAVSARLHFGQAAIDKIPAFNWLKTKTSEYSPLSDSVRTKIGYWQWTSPMLGIKANYPLILNKLYLEGGIYSGLSITSNPQHYLRIIDKENQKEVISETTAGKQYSIPLMVDGGLRMKLNSSIHLKLYGSFYQSNSNYEHIIYSNSQNSDNIQHIGEFDIAKKITTINVYAGIIYVL